MLNVVMLSVVAPVSDKEKGFIMLPQDGVGWRRRSSSLPGNHVTKTH